MQSKLKAFVRYDGEGKIVPFSLRFANTKPKNGDWEEIAVSQCCTGSTTTALPESVPPRTPDQIIACGLPATFDGGQTFPQIVAMTLGSSLGDVQTTYNMYNIPDRMVIYFDGAIVVDTEYRGQASYLADLNAELVSRGESPVVAIAGTGSGTTTFYKDSATTVAYVYIYGPLPGTAWTFTMSCPAPR